MIKKILEIIEKIKCKFNCCYQSQCSLNENKIDVNNINDEDQTIESRAQF